MHFSTKNFGSKIVCPKGWFSQIGSHIMIRTNSYLHRSHILGIIYVSSYSYRHAQIARYIGHVLGGHGVGVTCEVMMAGVDMGVVLKELIAEGLDTVVEMLSAIAVVVNIVVVVATSRVVDVLTSSDIGVLVGTFKLTIVTSIISEVVEMLSAIAVVVNIVVVMATSRVVDVLTSSDIGVLVGTFKLIIVTSIISEVVEILSAIAVVVNIDVMATSGVSNIVDALTSSDIDNGVAMATFELMIVTSLIPTTDEVKLS